MLTEKDLIKSESGSARPASCTLKREAARRKTRIRYLTLYHDALCSLFPLLLNVPIILFRVPSGQAQPQKTLPSRRVRMIRERER